MSGLTKAQTACLEYYRLNERNPDRRQARPPNGYEWTTRQLNRALDRNWLEVGPGGWHVLTEAGRAALSHSQGEKL